MALVDCQMKGCKLFLHHVCQGGYVAMHEIEFDGSGRKICCECIYDLRMGGKPEKSKMMQHSTVYHRWELPGNYPVFSVVMVIYHYVERI